MIQDILKPHFLQIDMKEVESELERLGPRPRIWSRFWEDCNVSRSRESYEKVCVAVRKERPLFDLAHLLSETGLNEDGFPNFAIARYDTDVVWLDYSDVIGYRFADGKFYSKMRWFLKVGDVFKNVNLQKFLGSHHVWAVVPEMPLRVIRRNKNLKSTYILWEAEWQTAKKPIDPILCRRIGGMLFEVLDYWDLTPLETSLLA